VFVPDAVPELPRELDQATLFTPLSSEAVPLISTLEVVVSYDDPDVGYPINTDGACVSTSGIIVF